MTRHVLSPLPYDYAALQPWIDEQTMRIHHDCHHQASVDALNTVEARLAAARLSGPEPQLDFVLLRYLQQLTTLYAAEHLLHCLFWENMGPGQGGQPRDELADQIAQDFGSFAAFKSEFYGAATSLEAGGWTVLVWQPGREQLTIVAAESQRLHSSWVGPALLALDMCEHAYYLKYQNRRSEYAYNWWNTVNWSCVARRFATATHVGLHAADARTTRSLNSKRRHRHVSPATIAHGVPHPGSAAGAR